CYGDSLPLDSFPTRRSADLLVDDAQVAAAIRGQVPSRVDLLLAVPEAGAEDPRDALVPGQLHEGFRIGDADQLGGFRPVADVVRSEEHTSELHHVKISYAVF